VGSGSGRSGTVVEGPRKFGKFSARLCELEDRLERILKFAPGDEPVVDITAAEPAESGSVVWVAETCVGV
jgi:hypothetical protein